MPRGYDRALYILPFDHRGSFQTKMFGWKSPLGEAQTTEISGSESQGFIGFALGRTVFWDPLVAWGSKKAIREQTVAAIAKRYREFVDLFERANTGLPFEHSDRAHPGHYFAKEA